jgi:hypothetical protein
MSAQGAVVLPELLFEEMGTHGSVSNRDRSKRSVSLAISALGQPFAGVIGKIAIVGVWSR